MDAQSSTYDAVTGQFSPVASEDLGEGVVVMRIAGVPTDSVAGTGYGTAAHGTYLANLVVPTGFDWYVNDGTALAPDWTLVGAGLWDTQSGPPIDGTTEGATGQGYYDDTNDLYYVCLDGEFMLWELVDEITRRETATAPTDHVIGTGELFAAKGSILISTGTPTLYSNVTSAALPQWSTVWTALI